VIICPKCTKENQDHYKFCLGCGAELPRDAAPKKFGSNTPPHGMHRPAEAAPVAASAPAPAAPVPAAPVQAAPAPAAQPAADAGVTCPQCGHANAPSNKFCASCGFKLTKPPSIAPAAAPVVAPAPAAVPAAPAALVGVPLDAPVAGGFSLTALRADGTEAGTAHLAAAPITLGRDTGGIFAGDSYLSPKHATFTPKGKLVMVRDESSLNGVYKKIPRDEPIELALGDIFRIGQEILKVEPLAPLPKAADGVERMGSPARGYIARLALVIGRDTTGNAFPIPETGLHLGRERGDVLFPEDGYVSGLHCRISWQDGKLFLTDLGSSNGSFYRLMRDTPVQTGDILLMGQQLFRVQVH
jgi:pSer/pThr/pTyr-binding forkhead associated (FHA) protein